MPKLAQRLLLPLTVLLCMQPAAGLACAIVAPDKLAEVRAQHVAAFKAGVAAISEEADLIFVGRLSKLTFSEENAAAAYGPTDRLRLYQAVFKPYEQIKGAYREGEVLGYTVKVNRVVVGCGPELHLLPKENGAGETYLVYAREGKVIRTNRIQTDTQTLSAEEETASIRELH